MSEQFNIAAMSSKKKKRLFTNEVQRWAFESLIDQVTISLSDEEEEEAADRNISKVTSKTPTSELDLETSPLSRLSTKTGTHAISSATTNKAAIITVGGGGGKTQSGKKKNKNAGKTFKLVNNSMSRLMPGVVQKNVTTERKFVKELLKLSQQRYLNLLNLDFQNRVFVARQTTKGIYSNENRRPYSDLKMANNATYTRSSTSLNDKQSLDGSTCAPVRSATSSVDNVRTFHSSKSTRKSANLIETMKLNSVLAKMHVEEVNRRRDSTSSSKLSVAKTPPIDTSSKLSIRKDSSDKSRTQRRPDETKIIDDIVVINTPKHKKESITLNKPPIQPRQSSSKHQLTNKSRNVTIQDLNQSRYDDTDDYEAPSVKDKRYRSLVDSMSTIYYADCLNDNINERVARIISSNHALTKGDVMQYDRVYDRMIRSHTFEDNLKRFERSISNII